MQLYFSTLGFRYFEFRFIYERIPNRIRIRIFGIFVLALLKLPIFNEVVRHMYNNLVQLPILSAHSWLCTRSA